MNKSDFITNQSELKTKTLEIIYTDNTERYDQIAAEFKEKIQNFKRKGLFLIIAIVVSVLVMIFMTVYNFSYFDMNKSVPMAGYISLIASCFAFIVSCLLSDKNNNMIRQLEVPSQIQDSYVLMNAARIIGMSLEGVMYVRYENNDHEVWDYDLKTTLTEIRKTDIDHYILDLNKSILYVPYSI